MSEPDDELESAGRTAAIRFARESLGPRSLALLADRAALDAARGRARAGAQVEDAVVGALFERAARDRELASELLRYLLFGCGDISARVPRLPAELVGVLDPDDLLQSVLGDLWPRLAELRFETRGQFLALLAQRLRWKAADHEKRGQRLRRRADLRIERPPEELGLRAPGASPLTVLALREEAGRLALALGRLPERDGTLLRLHLRGMDVEVLARECGLTRDAARKALQRAKQRVRALAASLPTPGARP